MGDTTTVRIPKAQLAMLREMARAVRTKPTPYLQMLIDDEYHKFKLVATSTLPHPVDAQAVPVMYVEEDEA